MRVLVITPPPPVITLEEAATHLRLDDVDEQEFLQSLIEAVVTHLDGPAGWLGRALGPQTLEARFDGLPWCGGIELPYPPLIDVLSFSYIDQAGAQQTLDASAFSALGDMIEPVFGASWPETRGGRETVRVQYRAGYVVDPEADPLVPAIPAPIRAALLLMVGDLWENRSTTLDARAGAAAAVPMSTTVEALLGPYRVWR